MSQDNKKSFVMYQGDGSNNVFSVPMTKGKFGTISVAFVRRGLSTYQYNPATFTLNSDNTLLTWTGATLNVGDFIVIQRTTTREQPFEFPNNQKHIEGSDDNLERQIQEIADAVDRALKIDPTYSIDSDKMNPLAWLETIVRSTDLSIRGLRYSDGWLAYSLDDPNVAEGSKTWVKLLNTLNVTTVRENTGALEYSVDGGSTWKRLAFSADLEDVRTLAQNAWDKAGVALSTANGAVSTAQAAVGVAQGAVTTAQTASATANRAETKSDSALSKSTDALDYSQQALDAVANVACRKYSYTTTSGQSTLTVGEDLTNKSVDLYWNGVLTTSDWSASGTTITLSFSPDAGDKIVVMVGSIRQTIAQGDLDAHNANPNAHANEFAAKATKVIVRRW